MASAFSSTRTTSDVDHGANTPAKHNRTVDLGRHSLNAVVAHNKSLWRLPQRWTQAHLDVLCVDLQSGVGADKGDLDQKGDGLSLHALVPGLASLEDEVESIAKGAHPNSSAVFLYKMLVLPFNGNVDSSHHTTKAIRFLMGSGEDVGLTVGPRSYRLPLRTIFRLGPLQLAYLNSTEIHRPISGAADSDNLSNQRYEPCIVAVLIALAQKPSPPTNDPVVKTRLLFTHSGDDQDIHLYTARVSQRLLELFRHPNQPPTNDACSHPASLVKLQHTRIPYQPYDTFRNRMLAAASVTATVVYPKDYSKCRKRKYSDVDDGIDLEQRPQGGLRKPLINISPNRCAS
ncbi:hypothetical protein GGR51DRAFT_142167 [Nemania sp. FL0031]|nr:hypothetical protein GGR51DRAFT_142167 [Nemania sp. FL0031]